MLLKQINYLSSVSRRNGTQIFRKQILVMYQLQQIEILLSTNPSLKSGNFAILIHFKQPVLFQSMPLVLTKYEFMIHLTVFTAHIQQTNAKIAEYSHDHF